MAADPEPIRAIYAALAAGDVGPLVDLLDAEVEWNEQEGAPVVAGTFRGRAAVLAEVLLRIPEVWEEVRIDPRDFVAAGDRVFVTGRLSVRARGTGARADVPFVHVWTLRDGRIVAWDGHTDTAMLQAARVSR